MVILILRKYYKAHKELKGISRTYDVIHPITGKAPFDNAKPTTLIKTLLSTFDKI